MVFNLKDNKKNKEVGELLALEPVCQLTRVLYIMVVWTC